MRHILSFDIAKGKSIYCFIDELRNVIIDTSLIEHKKDEFDLLFNKVKNYSIYLRIKKLLKQQFCHLFVLFLKF